MPTQRIKPHQSAERIPEPDLVDRVFDYLFTICPELADQPIDELKSAVRDEFAGERVYIARRPQQNPAIARNTQQRQAMAHQVLSLFNGRGATEVARSLGVSRATVYRVLKQSGRAPTPHSPEACSCPGVSLLE